MSVGEFFLFFFYFLLLLLFFFFFVCDLSCRSVVGELVVGEKTLSVNRHVGQLSVGELS